MDRYEVDHTTAHHWIDDTWPLYSTWNARFTEHLDSKHFR
jgi:hypothetical protein